MDARRIAPPGAEQGGFSLIEVALALMIAASGLVAAFSLFPTSLRQSAESHAYMVESTFASSVLETIAANVRQIDDIKVWNDPQRWLDRALSTGFRERPERKSAADLRAGFEAGSQTVGPFHLPTLQVAEAFEEKATDPLREVLYCGREDSSPPSEASLGDLQEPPQWILRLHVLKRPARSNGYVLDDSRLPARYLATIVCSPDVSPARYVDEPSYSQEYVFLRRP